MGLYEVHVFSLFVCFGLGIVIFGLGVSQLQPVWYDYDVGVKNNCL